MEIRDQGRTTAPEPRTSPSGRWPRPPRSSRCPSTAATCSRTASPEVWAVILGLALAAWGCGSGDRGKDPVGPTFGLRPGQAVALGVDYRTRAITPNADVVKAVIRWQVKDGPQIVTIDCSNLGGGILTGKIRAFFQGSEVGREEFRCLYQHVSEVALTGPADAVEVTNLVFSHVIE
jgi:hypothetical protein